MPAYLVGVYRHSSREAAEQADRMCAPSHEAESADTEIHDTPPVVLSGLVRGGEYATAAQYESAPSLPRRFVLLLDATGRIVSDRAGVGRALRTGAFPLTWYRYPEEP